MWDYADYDNVIKGEIRRQLTNVPKTNRDSRMKYNVKLRMDIV